MSKEDDKAPKHFTTKDLMWKIYNKIDKQEANLKGLNFWVKIAVLSLIGFNAMDTIGLIDLLKAIE